MKKPLIGLLLLSMLLYSCQQSKNQQIDSQKEPKLYLGADLSYVNEMEDCNGVYRKGGLTVDPYGLFSEKGANLIRLRLWHTPQWTSYSNFADVKKSIRRAKENHMEVLLDFHYSDTWADPQKQIIPKAWEQIKDPIILGDSMYQYTLSILMKLSEKDLLPEFVQVGNEVNIEILQNEDNMVTDTINWERNIFLLNKGIEAVRKATELTGKDIQIMIHIAQPENALWWFQQAVQEGLDNFEWIGISYYPKWSAYTLAKLPQAIQTLLGTFNKRVMIVETAYPYTLEGFDEAHNILGEASLHEGYPATPEGQLNFMTDLTTLCVRNGGEGVIYWEPAWISTGCSTPWGTGSHWENATFFDAANQNEILPVFNFFPHSYP